MVKRLEMHYRGLPEFDENGTWVFFTDYQELQQKLDALAAENAAMKSGAVKAEKVIMSSRFDYWTDRGELVSAVQKIIQTPSTDAYMNSVRAESLREVINSGEFSNWVNQGLQGWINRFNVRSGTHDTADKVG